MAQDLANKLGLKGRKAYVSPQTESTSTEGESHGETSPSTGEVGAVVTVQSLMLRLGKWLIVFILSQFY